MNSLQSRFEQSLSLTPQLMSPQQLVDARAVDFLLGRVEYLKSQIPSIDTDAVDQAREKALVQVAQQVAKITAGLVKQEPTFKTAIAVCRKPSATNAKSLEDLLRTNPSMATYRDETALGASLLHIAAMCGHLEACRILVEKFSCSVFTIDLLGRTPLHLAAMKQEEEVCRYLTDMAEKLENRSAKGESAPLDFAGLTPAAASVLASNPYSREQNEKHAQFETKRDIVRDHLHLLGDGTISPRKPLARSVKRPLTGRSRLAVSVSSERYGTWLLPGWNVKMEDFVVLRKVNQDLTLLCVMDGHGGSLCVTTCVTWLEKDEFVLPLIGDDLAGAARSIIEGLENKLKQMPEFQLKMTQVQAAIGNEPAQHLLMCSDESGSTITLCLLTPKQVCIAHLGDSRASLVAKLSHLQDRAITRDHKLTLTDDPEFVAQEKARVLRTGALLVNDESRVGVKGVQEGSCRSSLAMTRSLGDFWVKCNLNGDEQPVSIEPDVWLQDRNQVKDYLLVMASDGVWDVMTEVDVGLFVRKAMSEGNNNFDSIAKDLLERCFGDPNSRDNMSIIICDLGSEMATGGERRTMQISQPSIRRPQFTDSPSSMV